MKSRGLFYAAIAVLAIGYIRSVAVFRLCKIQTG
jgi:hypothetical protein